MIFLQEARFLDNGRSARAVPGSRCPIRNSRRSRNVEGLSRAFRRENEGRMREFSQLLDALVYTRSRSAKLKLIGDYLKRTPDPDRGHALAALTGELKLPAVKPAAIRAIVEERVDPTLFYMSWDYVGDLAETAALLWPKPPDRPAAMEHRAE